MNNDTQAAVDTSTTTAAVGAGLAAAKKAAKKPSKAKVTKSAEASKKPVKKAKAKNPDAAKGPAVLREYAEGYHKDTEKKTAGGHASIDNNDKTAQKLRGATLDEVYAMCVKVCKEDKEGKALTVAGLKRQYGHLNPGMQRMNLGNRIRAAS